MIKIDNKTLRTIRQELGYKKLDMCIDVGISLSAMTNIESGVSTPKDTNLVKIVQFLQTHGYSGPCVLTKT